MLRDPQQTLHFRKSRRSEVAWILVSVLLAQLVGCGEGATKTQQKRLTSVGSSTPGDGLELMDPGDDVMGSVPVGKSFPERSSGSANSIATGKQTDAEGGKGRWAVMLATFSETDHVARANAFRIELVRGYPELAQATVRRWGKGSAIVIGRFEGPQDKGAQAELKRVKSIERNGRKPFSGAMLLRTSTDDASAAVKAHDLRNLRAKYPKVRPLFTLQIAAWSTFGESDADYAAMRKAAERYCAELRAKGEDAWFHHDEDSETSIVTVGNFDRRAYDARTTLFAPEVEDQMRRFPAHLLNGEPLMVPIDPSNPKGRAKPQPCRLVEVPET